ncbi:MAG: GIY-YIG nuclease family protein [Halanaerobiales bacterium]|nr:GIY-YIG nuclease family protein [Halanaerobiales bacterium]
MQKYIYVVTNLVNGLQYVGQTKNPKRRWYGLCCDNDRQKITKAIQKYGKENFKMEILETCDIEEVDQREKYWIDKFNTFHSEGYNEHVGGRVLGKGEDHPRTGQKTPEEVKEKMRKSLKGHKTWNKRKGKNHPFYGKKHTKEELEKMRGVHKNSPITNFKQAIKIIKLYHETDNSHYDLARKYNCSHRTIARIINCEHFLTRDLKRAN